MALSGSCTVSNLKPCSSATRSIFRWMAGSLWPVKPDVTRLARFLRRDHRLDRAPLGKDPIGIVVVHDLVELQEIDVVGLQPLVRFVDLLLRRRFRATVELHHQKRFFAIAVAQGLAYPSSLAPPL